MKRIKLGMDMDEFSLLYSKRAELIDNNLKFLSVALEAGENEVVFTYSSPYVKFVWIGAGAAVFALCVVAFVCVIYPSARYFL